MNKYKKMQLCQRSNETVLSERVSEFSFSFPRPLVAA